MTEIGFKMRKKSGIAKFYAELQLKPAKNCVKKAVSYIFTQ